MLKRSKIISVALVLAAMSLCGFMCTPPLDLTPDCGLKLDVKLPKNADSIHVYLFQNDSIVLFLKDSIPCSKCERQVELNLSNKKGNNNLNWNYENVQMEEIVFCNGEKTIFPRVPIVLKNNTFVGLSIETRDEPNMESFVPLTNNCNIDSTYKISTVNDENCEE